MKTRRILLLQVLFFVLISLSTHLLKDYILIKRASYIILTIGLTFFLYKYFYNAERIFKTFLITLLSLFLLFELKKAVEYFLGLLPKYSENTLISAIGSLACIAIYLGIIILLCHLIKTSKISRRNV